MLTKEQVLNNIVSGMVVSECIDSRDFARLTRFFEATHYEKLGFKAREGIAETEPVEWTEENFLSELRNDLEFAFEKALDKRGLSANSMYHVVLMWLWILEDPLCVESDREDHYSQYGLPLLKAVAVKYGFPNPIGDDEGNEEKYEG